MPLRMRLFDSPATDDVTSPDEMQAVLTPDCKANDTMDSGFGSGANFSIDLPSRKTSRRSASSCVKKNLFCGKRLADSDLYEDSPTTKRQRDTSDDVIIEAVEKLEENTLVADGSRQYALPTIPGKHSDLKSITAETMADVIHGKYSGVITDVTIVDCRYPYEFEGGHIRGAVNLYTKDAVNTLLDTPVTSDRRHVLIFHCEFSSERGPKMSRFLRSQDRELNKESYPRLNFPEVYLLHGGYKAFYETQKVCILWQ